MFTTLYGFTRAVWYLAILTACYGNTLNDIMALHDALFTNASYNRNIRGLADQGGVVRVGASFTVVSLGEVMEREEAFSVMGLLLLSWKDERFVWNPSDYNGTFAIEAYQEEVWKPEVNLANPMLAVRPLGSDRRQVKIFSTGLVKWLIPDLFVTTCDIDVVSFPWDRQSCSLDFVVSTYSPSEVIIEADSDEVDIQAESKQWDLLKTTVVSQTTSLSKVFFWFCLERRTSFYVAVILIPIFVLSFLNVFVFFVKVDSGERISFSITLLLSITLYLSTTASSLPSHSKGMSAIIYCLNFILVESMVICIMSIYSLYVYNKTGSPSHAWQRIVARLLGRGRGKVETDDGDVVKAFTDKEIPAPAPKKGDVSDTTEQKELGITWVDVSLLIDRIFSLAAFLAILTSIITFASFVATSRVECI